MKNANVKLNNGEELVVPFTPRALGVLLAQLENGTNDNWDLGGVEVETKDIKEVHLEGNVIKNMGE